MRTRLTSAVVMVFVSLGILGAQAPQQADGQSAAEEKLRRTQRLLQVMSDPVIKKQLELAQAMAEAAEVARAKQREANTCAVPNGTRAALNAEVFFDGRLYRCVEVFGPNDAPGMANAPLKRRNAGLVRVQAAQVQ